MQDPVVELDPRFSDPDVVPTPWSEVLHLLEEAELYWISTTRADGRPHVAPLPAVWQDEALHFCTGADEQKGVNISRNPHCALTTGTNEWKVGLDVVVEGKAQRVMDEMLVRRLADEWRTKYKGDWDFEVRNNAFHDKAFEGEVGEALVFEVKPSKVISFRKGSFAQTRYRFE